MKMVKSQKSKIRTVIFSIVALITLCECSAGTVFWQKSPFLELPEGEISIDGADFTGFFSLMALMLNGFYGIIAVSIAAFSILVMAVLFRLTAYNKKSNVTQQELNLHKKILLCETGASMLIQMFGHGFRYWYAAVICSLISAGVLYLICIATVKTNAEIQNAEEDSCFSNYE